MKETYKYNGFLRIVIVGYLSMMFCAILDAFAVLLPIKIE